ncbi:TPA: hypothetical protein ACHVUQ_002513 [Klebsiella pneumoniae]|uniref:hypothetical protein n=2 Tax=Klebsiella/Raoultella group TaxID=2890311 RepID=UPI00078C2DD8|nr:MULTISPECIES: hypothetical protein [Klebsiella]QBP28534.1 hypothetical protein [Klebsiella phage ST899-OXA48phi17.1]AMV53132.1 hypothetical protein AOD72_20295 [Klebsiella pneumoniae subsp. pneumoniae]AMV58302.1 hypothetical protein AOG31_20040 [Klebsiella pneumoniae subsp. pneumoniae]AUJ39111.1 hypothetical protein BVU42_06660 [Klebsiella pneumoniae]AUJ44366.1 hypothetical protein BV506_06720 [Klebsiella pneumoniae]
MAELRAGGLALVIASGNQNEVGKTVTLIRKVSSGEFHQFPNGNSYAMKTNTGQSMWVVSGDVSIYTSKPSGGMSIFPAKSLMPIDGDDFSNEDEHQKEREHA